MTSDWQQAVANLQQVCRDTFGIPVVYLPSLRNHPELGGRSILVNGIFNDNREILSIMGAGERGLDALVPRTTLELRSADLGFNPLVGDEMTVGGVVYRVREVQPDGHGSMLLTLDLLSS